MWEASRLYRERKKILAAQQTQVEE